jgi:TRAP-type C4-dicarboxylate transport system permease small subunit
MTWINLFAVILVLGYALWVTYRGWRLFRNLLHATTISDVLKNILEQHHFYFIQGVGSFVALILFLGLKVLALLITPSGAAFFNTFIFGSFANRFLPGKLGCLGIALTVISLICFYQHVKNKHYLHVLHAFRNQLGLSETG